MSPYSGKDHTFVICAYKNSAYLEGCVRSLLQQNTASNVIAVTSTPSEHIRLIMQQMHIPLFINEDGPGIAVDWNYALSLVETPLATIAHQDDIYLNDYTSTMLEYMNGSACPLIFFSNYGELRGNQTIDRNRLLSTKRKMLWPLRFKSARSSLKIRRAILSFGSPICCPSVTFNLTMLQRPIFTVGYKSDLDWQAWERISKLDGSFEYCDRILMRHRIHEDSETSLLINNDIRTMEDLEMLKLFWPSPIAHFINLFYSKSQSSNQ